MAFLMGCGAKAPAASTTPSAAANADAATAVPEDAAAVAANGTGAADAACQADVRRQFDFWVGTWAVTNPKGVRVGTNRIESEQNGCVLTEHWTSARGQKGQSLNFYSAADKQWVQIWVDAAGGWLELRGGVDGDSMVLQGEYKNGDGSSYLLRGRWTPNADGSVRQFFESSQDGGTTWKPWFDGTYTRVETAVSKAQ